jgi:hypothetical protein
MRTRDVGAEVCFPQGKPRRWKHCSTHSYSFHLKNNCERDWQCSRSSPYRRGRAPLQGQEAGRLRRV